MSSLALIDAERLAFARLVTETARRTGGRSVDNVELLGSSECVFFICADIGKECVTHALELPPKAWTPALETELVKLFRGSAELALRSLGGTR